LLGAASVAPFFEGVMTIYDLWYLSLFWLGVMTAYAMIKGLGL
jgi:hypothetical protein